MEGVETVDVSWLHHTQRGLFAPSWFLRRDRIPVSLLTRLHNYSGFVSLQVGLVDDQ